MALSAAWPFSDEVIEAPTMWFYTVHDLSDAGPTGLSSSEVDVPFGEARDQSMVIKATHDHQSVALPFVQRNMAIVAHRLTSVARMKELCASPNPIAEFGNVRSLLFVVTPAAADLPNTYNLELLRNVGKCFWKVVSQGLWTITSGVACVLSSFRGSQQAVRDVHVSVDRTEVYLVGAERGQILMIAFTDDLRREAGAPGPSVWSTHQAALHVNTSSPASSTSTDGATAQAAASLFSQYTSPLFNDMYDIDFHPELLLTLLNNVFA